MLNLSSEFFANIVQALDSIVSAVLWLKVEMSVIHSFTRSSKSFLEFTQTVHGKGKQ